MAIQKIDLRPGVNRENTRYTNEGGWWESDKVRFRQGNPEKIGGWQRLTADTFLGVCRSLFNWNDLGGTDLLGVGTNLKFYLYTGGTYNDITPIRATTTNGITFSASNGSAVITATDNAHGAFVGDFVTFAQAVSLGGNITAAVLNKEYQITSVPSADTFTFVATATANSSDTGNGGSGADAVYQINTGAETQAPAGTGWGAGYWGQSTWGDGSGVSLDIRLWSQANFGEDLLFAPIAGPIYISDRSDSLTTRGTLLSAESGASNVPTTQHGLLVSDVSRFVFCFGCNPLGSAVANRMLVRWSDQEDATNWTPAATNQSGGITLSKGSKIVTAIQSRQEILVFTDAAVYAMQYVGAPAVWSAQLVGENTSIAGTNAVAYANGMAFWMGRDKFYVYDGRTQSLPCDLRKYIFDDFNSEQTEQVMAGTNESYHEIWWHYPSKNSLTNDKYVIYNYLENIWYYGTMARTAWLDSGIQNHPFGATYNGVVVEHELGTDDNELATTSPITASITSAQFDIGDGDRFSFVNKIYPDISFAGSEAGNATVIMSLFPSKNSGSGYNNPLSEGGQSGQSVVRGATTPIEEFTGEVDVRVRGRQLTLKVESTGAGAKWQLGKPRIEIRPDGRR